MYRFFTIFRMNMRPLFKSPGLLGDNAVFAVLRILLPG